MFPWRVRLLGICFAAIALLLMAMKSFGLHFNAPGFEEFLRWLGDGLSSLFAPLEVIIRDFLLMFDLRLPKLGEYWHHVFVLLWLLFGSVAKNAANASADDVPPLSKSWLRGFLIFEVPILLWAFTSALVTAVAVGSWQNPAAAILFGPIAGIMLFGAGVAVLEFWWGGAMLSLLGSAGFSYLGYTIAATSKSSSGIGFTLSFWVILIGMAAISSIAEGLLKGKTWRERLLNPLTGSGLDILAAYSIAFALAWAFGGYLPG